jgi:hypothetical protein
VTGAGSTHGAGFLFPLQYRSIMTTAAQYLGQFGISLELARNYIVGHVPDGGPQLLETLQAYHVSEEWLAEIFGVSVEVTRELAQQYLSIDTSVLVDSYPDATVTSVSAASNTEGGVLQHTVTLSSATMIETEFAASFGAPASGSPLSLNDLSSIEFSNGVTFNGTALVVPRDVTSFTITFGTQNDTAYEGTEGYTLTVGGHAAIGSLSDNDEPPPPANTTPLMPQDLSGLLPLLHLNDATGALSTASLRADIIARSNASAYAQIFEADGYIGAEDGLFTTAEIHWSLGDLPATSETIESLFYGTLIHALRAVDESEMNEIGAYLLTTGEYVEEGELGTLIGMLVHAFEDPAAVSFMSDADIRTAIVETGAELVGMAEYEPSVFHGLVNWIML